MNAAAVELTYSFVRDDLRDTLWAELDRVGEYQLVHRSGSF
jgi:hypothetical protein